MNPTSVSQLPAWIRYAPFWIWFVVYLLTCLLGAVLLLLDYQPFLLLFEYFSGVVLQFPKEGSNTTVLYALLFAAPLVLWVGYHTGTRLGGDLRRNDVSGQRNSGKSLGLLFALLTFFLSAFVAILSLYRGNAFETFFAWSSFDALIAARRQLFFHLGFFEFVNIYVFLPLVTCWYLIGSDSRSDWHRKFRWLLVAASLLFPVLLFQKKAVIVYLLLIMGTIAVHRLLREHRLKRLVLSIGTGTLVLVVVYFSMVVLPVYKAVEREINTQETQEARERLLALLDQFGGFSDHREAVFFYAVMAPLTRTSAPAIYYPLVYPDEHPFYGLDLGQDILGFGSMPDDNRVVWRRMNPTVEEGAVAAPFHFVLYSQVGLLGALAGVFIVGLLLGWAWLYLLAGKLSPTVGSMAGSLIMLFSVYLAIDSIRNSLVVSYGVFWGWVFLLWVILTERLAVRTWYKASPES